MAGAIPFGKRIWAVRFEARQFSPLFSLFRLISIYFVKALSPALSKFIVFISLVPRRSRALSILDSTVSCDVTERYSPALSQTLRGQRGKRERPGTRQSFYMFMNKISSRLV